ncbi:MAG: DUF2272 domain-containing protein [Gammaproteobacteria bacterium]|nr:DUF2272 domain-containing protein [Gammaproteobacteria bacterium]
MLKPFKITIIVFLLLFASSLSMAQSPVAGEILPRELLDVRPPSERVAGAPGEMRISDRSCRNYPASQVRQRIVDISIQEWAWFGSSVLDMTSQEELDANAGRSRRWWRTDWMSEEEARRVSDDIAGYWAAAPDSSWLLERQNQRWRELGITARWRDFWSAAFISWVMCEGGLGEDQKFQRAIAHHAYIDQAIRARDGLEPQAAYTAYDIGEAEILPGDMLCRGSRPEYRNLDQRRGQMGQGARTHCDVVVELDSGNNQIKVIGGNVRGAVRMKLLPAISSSDSYLQPTTYGERRIFAHLKLNTGNKEVAIKNIKPVSSKSG